MLSAAIIPVPLHLGHGTVSGRGGLGGQGGAPRLDQYGLRPGSAAGPSAWLTDD